jgi:hypothetical protein
MKGSDRIWIRIARQAFLAGAITGSIWTIRRHKWEPDDDAPIDLRTALAFWQTWRRSHTVVDGETAQ